MKKLIVIAIAFFVIAGGIWLYSNSQRSRTYTSNSKVSFTDKGFNISDGEKALAGEYISGEKLNLGIAVYPGATLIDSKDAAQNLDIAGVKIQAATYETNDAREKVETGLEAICSNMSVGALFPEYYQVGSKMHN